MPVISADAINTISALLIYNKRLTKGVAGYCGLDGTCYGANPYKAGHVIKHSHWYFATIDI